MKNKRVSKVDQAVQKFQLLEARWNKQAYEAFLKRQEWASQTRRDN